MTRQGFATGKLTGTDVILHGGKQGNPEFCQQGFRRLEIVALMRLDVGDVLHTRLNSLRHELRLLFGRLQGSEELPQAFAVPMVGDGEADPAAGVTAVNRHAGRAEFGGGNGFAVLAALGGWGIEGR